MLQRNENKYKPEEGPVNVRAVLTRRQHTLLSFGRATLEVPYGTSMMNRVGSTVLEFDCESREVAEELCEGLDNSGISWDEMA